MARSRAETARAVFRAYVERDRPVIEALIAPDFHFTSPLDNRLDRAAYFERCWPNSRAMEDFDFVHVVEEGEQVFVTYEARVAGGRRFRNTEVLTIRGEQLAEAEVYFGWSIPHEAPEGGFTESSGS